MASSSFSSAISSAMGKPFTWVRMAVWENLHLRENGAMGKPPSPERGQRQGNLLHLREDSAMENLLHLREDSAREKPSPEREWRHGKTFTWERMTPWGKPSPEWEWSHGKTSFTWVRMAPWKTSFTWVRMEPWKTSFTWEKRAPGKTLFTWEKTELFFLPFWKMI